MRCVIKNSGNIIIEESKRLETIGNIKELLLVIIGSVLGAIIYFYINIIIFLPLFNSSLKENQNLEKLKKEYEKLNEKN